MLFVTIVETRKYHLIDLNYFKCTFSVNTNTSFTINYRIYKNLEVYFMLILHPFNLHAAQ